MAEDLLALGGDGDQLLHYLQGASQKKRQTNDSPGFSAETHPESVRATPQQCSPKF